MHEFENKYDKRTTRTSFYRDNTPVSFARAVDCSLELLEVNERDGQTGEVGHVVVQQLGGLEHLVVETPVADL